MILNDPSALRRLDTLGSLAATEAYPEQFALGHQLARSLTCPQRTAATTTKSWSWAPAAALPLPARC